MKMREAEASLAMKELRQKFSDLHQLWLHHCSEKQDDESQASGNVVHSNDSNSKRSKKDGVYMKELEEQLMGVRIREAETLAELKECRQKVMELETLSHVNSNQIKRQDDENKRLLNELELCRKQELELQRQLRDRQRHIIDLETGIKEASVMAKLRETELLENVTELRNRISDLESKVGFCCVRGVRKGGGLGEGPSMGTPWMKHGARSFKPGFDWIEFENSNLCKIDLKI